MREIKIRHASHRKYPQGLIVSIVVWTVLLGMSLAAAQEAPEPPMGSGELAFFSESVDVRLVNLEVIVEKRGERIKGLESDNFVLRVDGEPVPIEFFTEIREGDSSSARATPTNYLVFIDDVFSLPELRSELLDKLALDLGGLRSFDRMAIVSYGGHSVDILQPWTTSKDSVKSAIEVAKARESRGWKNFWKSQDGPARAKQAHYEFERLIDTASSAVRSLERPEGRKVLVFLAGSWPGCDEDWRDETAGSGFETKWNPLGPSFGSPYWGALVDAANLVGYTVYTVDVPDRRRAWLEGGDDTETEHERNLRWLAERTGGLGLTRSWSANALERIVEDGSSYYSLAFKPTWRANDERRDIDVELVGAKGKVRVRDSFTDLSRQTETTLKVEAAHLFQKAIEDAEALHVRLGEMSRKGWRKALLPLEIEIPLDRVTHLPTASGYAAQLELRVAATDEDGDRSDIPVVPIALQFPVRPPAGATAIYETSLHVRSRDQNLLVSLVDVASGHHLTTRLDLSP